MQNALDYAINDINKHLLNEEKRLKREKLENELPLEGIKQPDSIQPQLTIPEPKIGNINYFANIAHPLIGRGKQKIRLKKFLKCNLEDSQVAWFQLAGVAGQGKSRLAYELMHYALKKLKWRAGFLTKHNIKSFRHGWEKWKPDKPYLFIFDYVIGREEEIKFILQSLIDNQENFDHKVRILLVERQPWNQGIILNKDNQNAHNERRFSKHISDKAEWFLKLCEENYFDEDSLRPYRFENGVEELKKLNVNDLVNIVKELLAQLYAKTLTLSDAILTETLERIDDSGRPLYAYLLAQQLSVTEEGYQSWTKIKLLNHQLTRDKWRWEKFFDEQEQRAPTWGESHPAMKLAVLATIVRQISFEDVQIKRYFGEIGWPLRQKAIFIASGYLINKDDHPQQIFAMEPHLLGEWFVLFCFYRGLNFEELLEIAWQYSPKNTALFLHRITQDFIDISKEYDKWDLIHELIAHKLPCDNCYEALAHVAVAITDKLLRNSKIPQNIIDALEYAGNLSDISAMNYLGFFYSQGITVQRNSYKTIYWYQQAIAKEDTNAMVDLGVCYSKGEGVEQDLNKAIELFHKANEKNDSKAMVNLGVCYDNGYGVERDLNIAIDLYQKAIQKNNSIAMFNLGLCYELGNGVKQNWDTAISLYEQAIEKGDIATMVHLGLIYQRGEGIIQDSNKAADLYWQAAKLGNSSAIFNLGLCYENGDGIEQDEQRAIDLFKLAVELGNSAAMVNLGVCYESGSGVEQSQDKAIELFQRAVELGESNAMVNLSYYYQVGEGVEQDWNKAISLYHQAITLGNSTAMFNLGICYENGDGVEKNLKKAIDMFQQAVEQGNSNAMVNLGYYYEQGIVVTKSLKKAIELYKLAAKQGDMQAMINLGYHQNGMEWFSD
ncbi:tetratricopeptide repeat protein [Nitrosomonas sp. Nm166]|uniref:tetratricopeptide repeat protein n=1 Tax=Nitrosomonas sp. Nm166 TaxID=1881054 RepID=UPI0008E89E0D|nr:SEL1-like repeat protein [Nitrosomonas sp. Nm166]SFE81224.1 TPR repeat [Nitrosomonas sp. Nm166]